MNILFFASDYKIGLSTLLTDQLLALHRNGINVYPVAGEKIKKKDWKNKLLLKRFSLNAYMDWMIIKTFSGWLTI